MIDKIDQVTFSLVSSPRHIGDQHSVQACTTSSRDTTLHALDNSMIIFVIYFRKFWTLICNQSIVYHLLFTLPHKVTLEPYVSAFQYKVLNSILYTNSKLYKIGYSQQDLCTFCKSYPEKLNHLLYSCPCSKAIWYDFELFWFSGTQETINLADQDVIVGVLSRPCPLLNYFLLIAKIYLWDCRRNQIHPNINGFKAKILIKCETEKYIGRVNKKMEFLRVKWANFQFS